MEILARYVVRPRVEGKFPFVRPKTFSSPTWERIAKSVPGQQPPESAFTSSLVRAPAAPEKQLLYCALHDQCYSLKAMREGQQTRRADETLSGEAVPQYKIFPG